MSHTHACSNKAHALWIPHDKSASVESGQAAHLPFRMKSRLPVDMCRYVDNVSRANIRITLTTAYGPTQRQCRAMTFRMISLVSVERADRALVYPG